MSGISFDEFDPASVGGFDRVAPGSYHAQIIKVDPEGGREGSMLIDFEILRGTTPDQVGRVHQERFSTDLKKIAQKKRAALAFATQIVTMDQAKAAKAENREIVPDWMAMVGRQVCLNLVESEHKGQMYTNLNFDEVWHPADKKANYVPLHAGMIERGGIKLSPERPIDGVKPPAKPPKEKKDAPPTATPADLLKGVV